MLVSTVLAIASFVHFSEPVAYTIHVLAMAKWILVAVFSVAVITVADAARIDRRTSGSSERLMIRPVGGFFTKPLGGAMLLTCIAAPNQYDGTPAVRWLDPSGVEIVDRTGKRRYIESDGNEVLKLYITSISPAEEGTYTCQSHMGGRVYEKTVTIKIFKDITFDDAPSRQYLRVNTTALIRCVVSAQPEAVVTWRFNNTRLTPGGRYTMNDEGLWISDVSADVDAGVYDCRGSVDEEGRYDERSITVDVHDPPKLTQGPGMIEGYEGTDVVISCQAAGNPPPTFKFYKVSFTINS